jgi:uncharacterized protein YecE (DUF72 family)
MTAKSHLKVNGTSTDLYVGTAGWSYSDWSGIVYPEDRPKEFRGLRYLVENCRFNTVELNNTFYRPPKPRYCDGWLRDVEESPDFNFTAKLWRRFTHEREEPWSRAEVETFREGIGPLVEAGRLGALLVQFPWSFRFNGRSMQWLAHVVDAFRDLPMVVEVRSSGWLQDRALRFLRELGVGFCNIDQPRFRNNIPLTAHGFGSVGYIRLHGRNRDAWFSDEAGRDERYDYLYSEEELGEIGQAVREAYAQVERMYVIANNHYRGQAPANALQLMALLTGEEPSAPEPLSEHFDIP